MSEIEKILTERIKADELIVSLFKEDGTAEIFEVTSVCKNGNAIQLNIEE